MLGANTIFCGKGLAMDCLNPFFLFLLRREPIITWFGGVCESEMFSCCECSGSMLLNGKVEISPLCAFISRVDDLAESRGLFV